MITRKLAAIETRLTKMMAKDETSQKKYTEAHQMVKAALEAANEGNHQKAYEHMTSFNTLMNDFKLNGNV